MDAMKPLVILEALFGCPICRRAWYIRVLGSDASTLRINIAKAALSAHAKGKVVCDSHIRLLPLEDLEEGWTYFDENGDTISFEDIFEKALEAEED